MMDKIVDGKLNKRLAELSLTGQVQSHDITPSFTVHVMYRGLYCIANKCVL
jgi:translation elongation factor EF-Ts